MKQRKKVNNLDELVTLLGKDTVDKCFTEYMMLMIARNHKLEELEKDLKDINDADMMTLEELKGRLK